VGLGDAARYVEETKSAYFRSDAFLPNETRQTDFTRYRLAGGTDTEILTFIDDHSRYALATIHRRVTGACTF
jgi:hypothetical protein